MDRYELAKLVNESTIIPQLALAKTAKINVFFAFF